jgi:hypothetical protein
MPVNTQISRDGEIRLIRWGYFHLEALKRAILAEKPDQKMFLYWPEREREWTFTQEHSFKDADDGEIFDILPGDTYKFWR